MLKALEGNGWSIQQAIQTTYSFDPRFYSSYLRPRLNRRNCDLPLVLIDGDKYEENITEPEWREAPIGTDYILEPVDSNDVFHPKVNLFASERSAFFSVSSANLTLEEYCKAAQIGQMAGFQKNWLTNEDESDREVDEAYYLSREIRDFFEEVVEKDGFVTGQDAVNYTQEMVETLGWLDEVEGEVETPLEDRSTVFLSSLSEPILSQTIARVGDIETARLYAPFYGTPNVLRNLADSLDPDQLELIVESESTALDTTDLEEKLGEYDLEVTEMEHGSSRWVHAKFLLLEGDWGSACLHGSPNMTSSALLQSSSDGNVETALLTVVPSSETGSLNGAVFDSQEFEFSVSEPVSDIESLELRSTSYEDWESVKEEDEDGTEARLEDVRLTQPDSDGNSELILKISGIDTDAEEHDITVRASGGEEKGVSESTEDESEVSAIIPESQLSVWEDAVVRADIQGMGVTNPRKVVVETQAYYREFREIVKSDGTQSSNTLLREVLENPDTTVMSVFDIALSEIKKRSKEFETVGDEPEGDEDIDDTEESFKERTATRLTKTNRQAPSLDTLIKKHLAYHRERVLDSLSLEDTPVPEDIEACIEHGRAFWETVELCYLLERNGEMDTSQIDVNSLFESCEDEISEWLSGLDTLVRRTNSVILQIENKDNVREDFVEDGEEVKDLEFWESIFEILLLHPGVVLEFDYQSEFEVYTAKNTFTSRIHSSLDVVHPHVEQHLYRGTELLKRVDTLLSNLTVELGSEETSVNISERGIQTLVFYVFLQEIAHSSELIQNLKKHPRYSQEDLQKLAAFSLDGREVVVRYDVISSLTLSVVLNEEVKEIEALKESG